MVFIGWGDNGPNPFVFARFDFLLPLSMWLLFDIIHCVQHQVWFCADKMGAIGGLICGHPKSVSLEVVNDICRAHWFVLRFGAGTLCLRGRCTCALLLVFPGGAALFGPMARFATVVAFALSAPSLPVIGCCGG